MLRSARGTVEAPGRNIAQKAGHPWEVAHNPYWEIDEAGSVILPG